MNISNKPIFPFAFGLLLIVFLSGCNSTKSPKTFLKPIDLAAGMTSDELLTQLGEPAEIKEIQMDGAPLELWVYNIDRGNRVAMQLIGYHQIIFFDPLTGEERMLDQPTILPQITKIRHTYEIVMDNERVVTWNAQRSEENDLIE